MKTTKVKAGKYQLTVHGFEFILTKEMDRWVLWNKVGTEVMDDDTKTAILNALSTYDEHDAESLNIQEWCR